MTLSKKSKIIQEKTEELGGIWEHFNQKVLTKGRTFGSGGLCGALSVVFLGRIASGQYPFDSYVLSEDGQDVVMDLAIKQRTTPGGAHLYLALFGLQSRYHRLGETIETICELVKIQGYYVITMSNLKGDVSDAEDASIKAHAVVVINAPPNFLFFDPNYGVGTFPSMDTLSHFLGRLWVKFYYQMDGCTGLERYSKKC